jgi:hypothetical protein
MILIIKKININNLIIKNIYYFHNWIYKIYSPLKLNLFLNTIFLLINTIKVHVKSYC